MLSEFFLFDRRRCSVNYVYAGAGRRVADAEVHGG